MSATTALESPAQPVTAAHAHIVRAHKRLVREFEKCAAAGERLKAKIGRSKAKLEAELERYKAKPPRFATLAAAQRYYKAKRQALLRAGQNAFRADIEAGEKTFDGLYAKCIASQEEFESLIAANIDDPWVKEHFARVITRLAQAQGASPAA
jgi:hypothetical protein